MGIDGGIRTKRRIVGFDLHINGKTGNIIRTGGVPAIEGIALHAGTGQAAQFALVIGALCGRGTGAAVGIKIDNDLCRKSGGGTQADRQHTGQPRQHPFELLHSALSFRLSVRRCSPVP